jgi:hypothetical protein
LNEIGRREEVIVMLDKFVVWQECETRTNLKEIIVLETLGGCDLLGDNNRVGQILIRKLVQLFGMI